MTTTQDCALVCEQESTYKTFITPTRANEYLDEGIEWNKNTKQGKSIRAAARVARSARRVVPSADGGGDLTFELQSKGLGKYLDSGFGTSTVTLVSGTTWQHVFTLGDNPKSLCVQKQLVEAGGTIDPYTLLGVMINSLEFTFPNVDIAQLKLSTDIGDISTAQGAASLVYPASPSLYHFGNWSIATGTLTAAPTTTALASLSSSFATFRDGSCVINNNLRDDRFNGGGGGRKTKPIPGLRDISGTATVEYADTTFRDAVLNDTPMALMFQYTGAALSTGLETVQLVLPEVKFDSELPKTNGTDLILQSMKFQVLDNLTAAQPIWLVLRTSDAAL